MDQNKMMHLTYGIYDSTTGVTHKFNAMFYDFDQLHNNSIERPESQLYKLVKRLYYHHAMPSYYKTLDDNVIINSSTNKQPSLLDVNLLYSDLHKRVFELKQYSIEEIIKEILRSTTNFYIYNINKVKR